MNPRKDQTEEQRIMRDVGMMLLRYLPEGAEMKLELKKLWQLQRARARLLVLMTASREPTKD